MRRPALWTILLTTGLLALGLQAASAKSRPAAPAKASSAKARAWTWEVRSARSSTAARAWQDALEQGRERVAEDLRRQNPPIFWTPPSVDYVRKLVKSQKEEQVETDDPDLPKTMYVVTLGLEADPSEQFRILQADRSQRAQERALLLARGLAVLVTGLGALAVYIRLDTWSKGYLTSQLRLILAAVVIGAAVLACVG